MTARRVTWASVLKAVVLVPLGALALYAWPAGVLLGLLALSRHCHGARP